MKLFIPNAADEKQALKTYGDIKKFASHTTGWDINDRQIYGVKYRHDGKDYEAWVGEKEKVEGNEVIAILESRLNYFICSQYRGVEAGHPIMIDRNEVKEIVDFED